MEYNAEDYDDYQLLPNNNIRLFPKDKSLPSVDVSHEQGKPIRDVIDAKRGSYVEVDSKDDGAIIDGVGGSGGAPNKNDDEYEEDNTVVPMGAGGAQGAGNLPRQYTLKLDNIPPPDLSSNKSYRLQPTSLSGKDDPDNLGAGGGLGFGIIPGKFQLQSTSTQRVQGPGLTAQEKEVLQGLADDRKDALTDLETAEIEANQRRIEHLQREQELYAQREQNLIEQEARLREKEQLAIDAKRQADEEAANYKVDPTRFWKDKSGWTKALAAIGAFVSAAAAARSKTGRNYFMESMNKIIETDIEAQKEELKSLERKAKAKKDDVELTFIQNERERLSENILWQNRLGTLSAELRAIEEESQNPIIRARAGLLRQDVDEALANKIIEAEREKRGTTTRTAVSQRSPDTFVVGGVAMTPEQAAKLQEQIAKDVNEYGKETEDIVNAANSLRKIQEIFDTNPNDAPGLGWIDRMKPGFMTGEEGRRMRYLLDNYIIMATRALYGAAASEKEGEYVRKLVYQDGTEEGIRIGIKESIQELNNKLQHISSRFHPLAVEEARRRGAIRPIVTQ